MCPQFTHKPGSRNTRVALSSDASAYTVEERRPGQRFKLPPCASCGGTVEAWAAPLDVRVPALCDRCQRTNCQRAT
jgi:hypothetical protein